MKDNGDGCSGTEWEKMTGCLPPPADPDAADLLWREFCVQFRWYDRAANRNRRMYQILKFLVILAGAAVSVLAALAAPAPLTASVGAAIVVIEGAQQLGQFHANWLNYRATAERMRQHGFSYAAGTVPYDDPHTRRDLLGRSMRETIAKESGIWSAAFRKADREDGR